MAKINSLTIADVTTILLDSHFKKLSDTGYRLDGANWLVTISNDVITIIGNARRGTTTYKGESAPVEFLTYLLLNGVALGTQVFLAVTLLNDDYVCALNSKYTQVTVYGLSDNTMCAISKQINIMTDNNYYCPLSVGGCKQDLKLSTYINGTNYEVGNLIGCSPIQHGTDCNHKSVSNYVTFVVNHMVVTK